MIDRIRNLWGIGRMTLADDTGEMQLVQVTEGQAGKGIGDRVTNLVRRVTEFGFTSVPPLDSEVLVARRGGERTMSMVVGTSHRPSRLKGLQPGDTGIYDVRGAKVMLTADGLLIDCAGLPAIVQNCSTITLKATEKVTIDAPDVECTGNLKVDQLVTGDGTPVELGALRDAFNSHKHGGVKTGSDTSAGPSPTV